VNQIGASYWFFYSTACCNTRTVSNNQTKTWKSLKCDSSLHRVHTITWTKWHYHHTLIQRQSRLRACCLCRAHPAPQQKQWHFHQDVQYDSLAVRSKQVWLIVAWNTSWDVFHITVESATWIVCDYTQNEVQAWICYCRAATGVDSRLVQYENQNAAPLSWNYSWNTPSTFFKMYAFFNRDVLWGTEVWRHFFKSPKTRSEQYTACHTHCTHHIENGVIGHSVGTLSTYLYPHPMFWWTPIICNSDTDSVEHWLDWTCTHGQLVGSWQYGTQTESTLKASPRQVHGFTRLVRSSIDSKLFALRIATCARPRTHNNTWASATANGDCRESGRPKVQMESKRARSRRSGVPLSTEIHDIRVRSGNGVHPRPAQTEISTCTDPCNQKKRTCVPSRRQWRRII